MPAEVEVISINGATPGDIHVVTSDRYSCTDTLIDPGLASANQVPGSGLTSRSMWKHRGLHVKGGSFSQLSNWRWGGPGNIVSTWGLGSGMIQVALKDTGDSGCPIASYCQAKGVEDQYGYDIKAADPNGHTFYNDETAACADMDNYTSTTPLVFDTTVLTTTGYTKLVVTQLVLEDDTTFGEKSVLYEFWRWQEI